MSGNGPMFVNVLESQAAYCVVGEYDPADCEHVEVRSFYAMQMHACTSHQEGTAFVCVPGGPHESGVTSSPPGRRP